MDQANTKKVYIKTYGCQMNVYDSERMADVMGGEGYSATDTPDDADLVILNTCHIREKAAEKVYSDIGRLRVIREKRSDAGKETFLAVAGCVGQAEGGEMMRRAPTIDMVLGPQTYHRLPEMLVESKDQRAKTGKSRVLDTDFPAEAKFDHLPKDMRGKGPAAFLTVQEGCDKFCTFCVVPYTRGAEFSRPVKDLVEEAERMAEAGIKEITLLGQNVNAYHGARTEGGTETLAGLIREIATINGVERIRYTTSHPRDMDDELIAAHAEVGKLMPYLHLPVQSGSNKILDLMNRKHTRETYFEIIERLRAINPGMALSGDFIVGFPGETDEDFEQTMDLVRRVTYSQAYSFMYSPRPGTPASVMETQVPEDVKSERLQRLQALLNEQQRAFNDTKVGDRMPVLLERMGKFDGQLVGRTPFLQAVHVDVKEALDESDSSTYTDFMGQIVDVDIISAGPNSLQGALVRK